MKFQLSEHFYSFNLELTGVQVLSPEGHHGELYKYTVLLLSKGMLCSVSKEFTYPYTNSPTYNVSIN